jgi:chaperonin GroES
MNSSILTPKPMNDHVIVLRDAVEDKTESGIIIPDTAKERNRPHGAVVLAINPDSEASSQFTPGDRVITKKLAGYAIDYMGVAATLLQTDGILCLYEFNLPSMADVVSIIEKAGKGDEAAKKYLVDVMAYLNSNHIDFDGDDAMIVMEIAGFVDGIKDPETA